MFSILKITLAGLMLSSHPQGSVSLKPKPSIQKSPSQDVIGFPVCVLSLEEHIDQILEWASARLSKIVCVANVHMLMEAHWNEDFAGILRKADMLTPDGAPLAWMVGWLRLKPQERVAGMDVFLGICQRAKKQSVKLFFIGSTSDVLSLIKQRIEQEFPNVEISGIADFPFRQLTAEEDNALVGEINQSGANIVMVSLGCPKQERWMSEHQHRVHAVMIGLGGAFPVFAGQVKRAPTLARKLGLEWMYRLVQEPKRLWKRYYSTIPPFVFLALRQAIRRSW